MSGLISRRYGTLQNLLQKEDGHVAGAETSITRSGGESLLIETTSLTTLCWLNEYQVTIYRPYFRLIL